MMDFANLTKVEATRKKETVISAPKQDKSESKLRFGFTRFIVNKDTDAEGKIVYTVNDTMYGRQVMHWKAKRPVDAVIHNYVSRCYGLGYCHFNFKLITD